MSNNKETLGFQTEVKQLLHLVVHSLYSNKEIFLRELISNASDALDKLRFLALSDVALYDTDADLKITIDSDETLKTITIKDNGIGMNRAEAIDNLGTIAKSGTKEFLSHLTGEKNSDSQLIGQFGVGFYSAFIVADKVTVKSRRAGAPAEEGIVWESTADGQFTINNENLANRGTEITLHLKKEEEAYLNDWQLRNIITKYSDHICWPIVMKKNTDVASVGDDEDQKIEENNQAQALTNDTKAPEFEAVNKATALWTLSKTDITEQDYQALYKHISNDYQDPLIWSHNHVEGKHDYISLLYIPAHAPFDMWQQEAKHGLKLFVKRVFILDEATQFLPRYLRFVKGIIGASDLPLNVSREILQDNKQVEAIKSACTKRVLSMIEKMSSENGDAYQKFWKEFGQVIKEGPVEDFANRELIAKLLRFASTHTNTDKQDVSLSDYVSRMQEKQDKIYFITASSYNAAKFSPHLEIFKKKNIEVLLLSDRIDEWLVGYLNEFEGKKLQSISKGKVDFDNEDSTPETTEEQENSLAPMIKQIKSVLGDKVKEVALTTRLTDSPACVVADEKDMGLEMQRILQAAGQQLPNSKPIFEINGQHPLIKRLHDIADDAEFAEWVNMLFEQALLAEGGTLDNPADFVKRVNKLLLTQ